MKNSSFNRILVIEDQGVSRMLLCHYLEEQDFQTVSVKNFKDASKMLDEQEFCMVILETLIEDMGLDFIKELRTRFNKAELPIIVTSSLSEESDIKAAFEAGASDYIIKPAQKFETVSKVKQCLDIYRNYHDLKSNEERLDLAIRGIKGGIFDWNVADNVIFYSPRACELLNLEYRNGRPGSIEDILDNVYPGDYDTVNDKIKEHIQGKEKYLDIQYRVMYPDGTHKWVLMRGASVRGENGQSVRFVGNVSDISNSLSYDNVTGLPGSHVFFDLLERSMVRSIRNADFLFGLLNITVNDTEKLSESLTSNEMDTVWASVSRRLQLSSRASDLISRVEYNRFAVLLEDLREVSDAMRVANRMSKALSTPIRINDRQIEINTSIGIAVSCDEYESPENLLSDAYKTSILAQNSVGYRCRMCNERHQKTASERLTLEHELYDAVAGRQFRTYYLPIVNTETKKVTGIEVLLRWKHPSGILMSPDSFLDLCDRDQLIIPIGSEIMKHTADQLTKVNAVNALPEDFTVHFNITARQFYDEDLLDNILLACQKTAVKPENIRLEIQESVFNKNFEQALTIIDRLAEAKIRCIIDQFGTNPLPLNRLFSLKLAAVKGSYADCAGHSREEVIKTCQIGAQIGKMLKTDYIAVGIEKDEIAQEVKESGCILQEGFAFGAHMTLNDLEILAENGYVLK